MDLSVSEQNPVRGRRPCYLLHDLQSEVDGLEAKVHALEHDRSERGDGLVVHDTASRMGPEAVPPPLSRTNHAGCPVQDETHRAGWTHWMYREDGHLKRSVIFAICTSIAAFVFGTLVLSLRRVNKDKEECIRCHVDGAGQGGAGPGPS